MSLTIAHPAGRVVHPSGRCARPSGRAGCGAAHAAQALGSIANPVERAAPLTRLGGLEPIPKRIGDPATPENHGPKNAGNRAASGRFSHFGTDTALRCF